jgi:hypothetical protein
VPGSLRVGAGNCVTSCDLRVFVDEAARKKRLGADELVKGCEVDVIGYVHEREQLKQDGETKMIREIYAVAVKKR